MSLEILSCSKCSHGCCFNSTSGNGVCLNTIPEDDEDIETNKVTSFTPILYLSGGRVTFFFIDWDRFYD